MRSPNQPEKGAVHDPEEERGPRDEQGGSHKGLGRAGRVRERFVTLRETEALGDRRRREYNAKRLRTSHLGLSSARL